MIIAVFLLNEKVAATEKKPGFYIQKIREPKDKKLMQNVLENLKNKKHGCCELSFQIYALAKHNYGKDIYRKFFGIPMLN